ncbi:MAG: HD domain-containing protein [Candidatus Kentron sp. G]|nr:MAG: HD domain-containing protein [Candidatus Kentron sp. G]VFN06810.1 MAG: HD domain-containing protein [Candidatus Kentron sp. G]VFN07141.1 MAG: HD domain-containing protein [Candidatus Kentron sp. G]
MRQFGGVYPSECDTVAGHSSAVSVLATVLAYEFSEELKSETGVELNLPDVTLMATFHDFGEARSGDTGVSSLSVHSVCKLFPLEREGLEANLKGLKISRRVLELFDDYRGYKTPEALSVHIADNLEGIENLNPAIRK